MNRPTLPSEERKEFRGRVRAWAVRLKVEPSRIELRRMTRKWASCSSRKHICFAEALLAKPVPFQDYVIVHELLHLRVPNHGRLFKSLLGTYLPKWRECAGWAMGSGTCLRENALDSTFAPGDEM